MGGAKGAKAPRVQFSRQATRNALYTWLGVFLTLLALSGANVLLGGISEDRQCMHARTTHVIS